MAEEASARRVDAIGPAAEIDAVQIQLQDLLLAELAFHRHGEDDLAELPGEFARVREEDVAGKLLRDGGRALIIDPARAVNPGGAGDADRIAPRMAVEAPVLPRHHRTAHNRPDFVITPPHAIAHKSNV